MAFCQLRNSHLRLAEPLGRAPHPALVRSIGPQRYRPTVANRPSSVGLGSQYTLRSKRDHFSSVDC